MTRIKVRMSLLLIVFLVLGFGDNQPGGAQEPWGGSSRKVMEETSFLLSLWLCCDVLGSPAGVWQGCGKGWRWCQAGCWHSWQHIWRQEGAGQGSSSINHGLVSVSAAAGSDWACSGSTKDSLRFHHPRPWLFLCVGRECSCSSLCSCLLLHNVIG